MICITLQVLVSLTDENDNTPIFTSSTPTSVSIVENTSPGSIVTVVTATDADQGSNGAITYSITSGDPNGMHTDCHTICMV